MRQPSASGYTLLEILLVIALLATVAEAFSLLLVSSWRTQQLRDAAITVSTELGRARTAAMKSGQSQTVVWTERSFSAGVGRSVTLPDSVTLSPVFESGVRYLAPTGNAGYPDEEAGGYVWTLTSASGQRLEVAAIGVLGKPVLRAP